MRRICAVGLATLLGAQPVAAEGPLARSLATEAARLAATPVRDPAQRDWQAMWLLNAGDAIVISTADATIAGQFDQIDERELVVKTGIDVKRIGRDDVLLVERQVRRGSAAAAGLGAAGGVWLGYVMALHLAFGVRCQPACGGVELAIAAALIGTPIAAGYGAWRATSRLTREVIYRVPARP